MKTQTKFQKKVYLFLDKFLQRKIKEAKRESKEFFYFLEVLRKYILENFDKAKVPIFKIFKNEKKDFLNIYASLILIWIFFKIFDVLTWKKSALKDNLVKNIFRKYKNDKTKKDLPHITFSQVLVLGDIVGGFAYEIILLSKFSEEQKINMLAEINNIIKWHSAAKLSWQKDNYFFEIASKIFDLANKKK